MPSYSRSDLAFIAQMYNWGVGAVFIGALLTVVRVSGQAEFLGDPVFLTIPLMAVALTVWRALLWGWSWLFLFLTPPTIAAGCASTALASVGLGSVAQVVAGGIAFVATLMWVSERLGGPFFDELHMWLTIDALFWLWFGLLIERRGGVPGLAIVALALLYGGAVARLTRGIRIHTTGHVAINGLAILGAAAGLQLDKLISSQPRFSWTALALGAVGCWFGALFAKRIRVTTDLVAAACVGSPTDISRLLTDSHLVDSSSDRWVTPLMEASVRGNLDNVRTLIAAGADVNARIESRTPLSRAAQGGDQEVVRVLLDAGAHVEDSAEDGFTPLMCAVSAGHVGAAKLLLERGADPSRVRSRLQNALDRTPELKSLFLRKE